MEALMKSRPKKVDKTWGYELHIVNTDAYCGKLLYVEEGKHCSLHLHKKKDETFHVLDGKIKLEYQDTWMVMDLDINRHGEKKCTILSEGDSFRLPKFQLHRFTAIDGDALFMEVSTHDDPMDSYRVEPTYKEEKDGRSRKRTNI